MSDGSTPGKIIHEATSTATWEALFRLWPVGPTPDPEDMTTLAIEGLAYAVRIEVERAHDSPLP